MSEFLGIDINILDDCVFKFYPIIFIRKVLEDTGVDNCKCFPSIHKGRSTSWDIL